MPVETVNYINDLNPDWPDGTEPKSQGDNHLRNTKKAIKQTLPNVAGPVSASHVELSHMAGVTAPVQGQLDARAQKSGSVYTGTHDYSGAASVKLPAATNIGPVTATELGYLDGVTSGVQAQFDGVNTTVAGKVDRSGDTYTGAHDLTGATVTVTTQAVADNTTKAASTKFVKDAIADAALSSSLPGQAGNAGKVISTDGANAFWAFVDFNTQVSGKPDTLSGYGITDGVTTSIGTGRDKSQPMAAAPIGQPCAFVSTSGAGPDWPTALSPSWWNVFTYGITTRLTQRAEQVFDGPQKGWIFVRYQHDGVWSGWMRVMTDGSIVEKLYENPGASGALTVSPIHGSAYYLFLTGNVSLTIPVPRPGLDQYTFMIAQFGANSVSWSANVRPPVGGIPAIPAGYVQTITLYSPSNSLDLWLAAVGPRHPLS